MTQRLSDENQAIRDSLSRAHSLVNEAEKARGSDESSFKLLLWKAAAEAEYLAFQISLTHRLSDNEPVGEQDDEVADPPNPLETAQSLLEKARASISSNPKDAYRAVRKTVSVLRSWYVELDKPVKKRVGPSPTKE